MGSQGDSVGESTGPFYLDHSSSIRFTAGSNHLETQRRPAAGKSDPWTHTAWEAEAHSRAGLAVPGPTCRGHALRGHPQQLEASKQSMAPPTRKYVYCIQAGRKGVCGYHCINIFSNQPLKYVSNPSISTQLVTAGCYHMYPELLQWHPHWVPISTPAHMHSTCNRTTEGCSYTSHHTIALLKTILEPCLYLTPNNVKRYF